MTISTTDLKIYLSQRNRDTDDGGGAMSPNQVVDGEINNLFGEVSSEDRVGGRVNILKAFPGVYSNNTDKFFGAGLLMVEPSHDDAVDVIMCRATRYDDERADVVSRIESYLAPGKSLLWRLFNDHLSGSLVLTLYAPEDAATPDVGETIFLEDNNEVQPTEAVRVQSVVSRTTQTFYDSNRSFQRDVLALELTRPLQADWSGSEVLWSTTAQADTRLRGGSLSESSRFYGVKAVQEDIAQGDMTVKVNSPFSRIVPSTTAEQPVTDLPAGLTITSYEQTGPTDAISVTTPSESWAAGETKTFHTGGTLLPGSVAITGTATASDDGTGTLEFTGSTWTGEVDFFSGSVSLTRQSAGSGSFTITATPGAGIQGNTLVMQIPVQAQNRNLNYIRQLIPRPAPGTITVDYRALSNWYRLADDGTGTLVGESPGQGAGSINFATGTLTATLAALPDINTAIIMRWGSQVVVQDASSELNARSQVPGDDATTGAAPGDVPMQFVLDPLPAPGTLVLNYDSGAVATVIEDSSGALVLQGTATQVGSVDYAGGICRIWASIPDHTSIITATYSETGTRDGVQRTTLYVTGVGPADTATIELGAAVEPGTFEMDWKVRGVLVGYQAQDRIDIKARDNGNGLVTIDMTRWRGASHDHAAGSINYATGQVVIDLGGFQINWHFPSTETITIAEGTTVDRTVYRPGSPVNRTIMVEQASPAILVQWYASGAGGPSVTRQIPAPGATLPDPTPTNVVPPAVDLNLTPNLDDRIIPGSVRFTFNGDTYVDRMGDLVRNPDVTTNFAPVAGTIDYDTGAAKLDDWSGGAFQINVVSLGVQRGLLPTAQTYFRTPVAPIASSSLTVTALRIDTETPITGVPDINGIISTAEMEGFVDTESGLVEVFFGEEIVAAGNEQEEWYDAANVDEFGNIWKPIWVDPSTITFSALGFVSIPLDPELLGLDPILLPSDGRVPIFRKGDSLMLVQRTELEDAAPTAGGTVALGISNVAWARVKDVNGQEVISDLWSVDAAAGNLIWANPLDLATYTGPYTIEAMAYFKRLCTDVQVDGSIGLSSGAPFPMARADADVFLASKLIFKPEGGTQDLQALVLNLFTQETWSGEWANHPVGNSTVGAYDDVNFPVEISNNGSITERWRLEFIGTSTVNVIGERFGQVLTGAAIASDIAPINPATGTPYFTIRAGGWSGGWQIGNNLFLQTVGANDPVWFIRTVQPGDAPELTTDRFIAHLQGDISQS